MFHSKACLSSKAIILKAIAIWFLNNRGVSIPGVSRLQASEIYFLFSFWQNSGVYQVEPTDPEGRSGHYYPLPRMSPTWCTRHNCKSTVNIKSYKNLKGVREEEGEGESKVFSYCLKVTYKPGSSGQWWLPVAFTRKASGDLWPAQNLLIDPHESCDYSFSIPSWEEYKYILNDSKEKLKNQDWLLWNGIHSNKARNVVVRNKAKQLSVQLDMIHYSVILR